MEYCGKPTRALFLRGFHFLGLFELPAAVGATGGAQSMNTRSNHGISWGFSILVAICSWLFVLSPESRAQIRLDTTGSTTTGNRYYKVEQAAPDNTGLAKLICASPYGEVGYDSIRYVRILRDRTILVAGNRKMENGDINTGIGFLMRLTVSGDSSVTARPRVDLPGSLNSLKLDTTGRICVQLDGSAVYMIEPGAPEPIKYCVLEGIRDFCTDSNGELLLLTKEELIRYDASWEKEMWKVKIPCHGVNQRSYLAACGASGITVVVGSGKAHNGQEDWRGPYAQGFDREGKNIWTLWDFDPRSQLSKKNGGNDLTAEAWGRSVRMGRDGKVYLQMQTSGDKTVLLQDPADVSKKIDPAIFDGAFEATPGKSYSWSRQVAAASVLFRADPISGAIEHGTWMNAWLTPNKKANPLEMRDVATDKQGRTFVVGMSESGCPVKDPWYYDESTFRGHGFLAIFDKDFQMLQCGFFQQTNLTTVDSAYGYVVVGGWLLSGASNKGLNLKAHNPIQDKLSDYASEAYFAIFSTGDHGQPEALGPMAGSPAVARTPAATKVAPPVAVKTTPAEQAAIELQIAKDFLGESKFPEGMAKLDYVIARYGTTPAGAEAKTIKQTLAKDAAAIAAMKATAKPAGNPEDEKAADRLLQQAENYLANGMKKIAREKLKTIVKKYPKTKAGRAADKMLLKNFGI